MKFVQTMGLLVLIALGMPAPKLTMRWAKAIRTSEALASWVDEIERKGTSLESLPVMPLEDLRAGADGVVCDEVMNERTYVPVCVGVDAVYLSAAVAP